MADTGAHRRRRRLTRRTPPGAPPGTLSPDPHAAQTVIRTICYDTDAVEFRDEATIDDVAAALDSPRIVWVDATGLGDIDTVRGIGDLCDLHSLTLEDIVNVHQRPKLEDYGDYLYVALRMPDANDPSATEQVSLVLGENYVVTFQERSGDCFQPVRDRLRDHRGRLRDRGADYLAYALIDAVIDAFFPRLEEQGEILETLEAKVIEEPAAEQVADIHRLKRDLLTMRRAVWPLRELLNGLLRDSHPRIDPATQVYLRDCYDHTVQLMDMIDTNREMAGALVDLHLSSVSNRMNEVMKVLTIIATIFIPLGFVAGVYGMNFNPAASPWNMPELAWRFGYPAALGLMAVVAIVMLAFFWRWGWIGRPRRKR